MSDLLLSSPLLRGLLGKASVPVPAVLPRERGPWSARLLDGQRFAFAGGETPSPAVRALLLAGASLESGSRRGFEPIVEAYARPIEPLGEGKLDGVVIDATDVVEPSDLAILHRRTAPLIPRLRAGGRVVLLARAGTIGAHGVGGFGKSLAKELGRRGSRANVVVVKEGEDGRAASVVVFLASRRSAFVDGQIVPVDGAVVGEPRDLEASGLAGVTAVVTGAARGIGRAAARRFAEEGAHVVCVDRPDTERETSQLARELHGTPCLLDVTAPDASRTLIAALSHRRADVLIHNAGVTRDRMLVKMSEEDFRLAVDVSLTAPLAITHDLGRAKKLGSRVVFLSSIAGIAGNVGQTNYAAAKAGVIGAVRELSARLAARGTTVNAVAPGFIETRMTAEVPLFIREAGRRLSSLSQGGRPEDVAEALVWLSMPASNGVSGAVVRVCGQSLLGA